MSELPNPRLVHYTITWPGMPKWLIARQNLSRSVGRTFSRAGYVCMAYDEMRFWTFAFWRLFRKPWFWFICPRDAQVLREDPASMSVVWSISGDWVRSRLEYNLQQLQEKRGRNYKVPSELFDRVPRNYLSSLPDLIELHISVLLDLVRIELQQWPCFVTVQFAGLPLLEVSR